MTTTNLPQPLRDTDIDKALQAANPRMRVWLCLMAYAGLRCSEVAALTVEDLMWDLDPPMIHVRDASGGGPPPDRLVPLTEVTEDALRTYGLPQAGAIFRRGNNADRITAQSVSQAIKHHFDDLGIDAWAHQLRHYFSTKTYEQTRDQS